MHLFVDQLTNVDFSYLDPHRGLVGETWWASAVLEGALDEQGMVCDFGIVKKTLRNWLDLELDHRLLIPVRSPALQHCLHDDKITLTWHFGHGQHLTMTAPQQAVALVDAEVINDLTVAEWSITQLSSSFPGSIEQLSLTFENENIHGANYHYSHGLKKHDGNCQRIAHGHRSRIEIFIDGERNPSLEQQWANTWEDIYLGTVEDLSNQTEEHLHFHYHAQQGEFTLSLPKDCCYLMDTDTTVELIAAHLAQEIKRDHPSVEVCVRAFEGVNKGAMVAL
ncbi:MULTISPECIES: 6-carboxytetrahydropterin synthase [Thalassolituus]|jgi:6-pyruvoyl-tetrahydropterin synthase|uniref:NADPH dependent preQ0 reductase n=1 Tax=hydrothermal vent metagenome TaxID=652676 RepID=A0A160TAI6_9ZZZZ|nr:6-carboxytetrahydropterin synthase [Thalassolituus oleivorans]MBQ0725723.1 6-carboxytetrahydropterin synthase [Thalassolituus oleivorans]MCA6129318.1 hypothetical protein [Thalassolituus oleivorans 4BN06-13]MDF1641051.1 6-carboxytetrahydropterin synthase [Thalassolituus oleivorans]